MNMTNQEFVMVGGLARTGGTFANFFLDGTPGLICLPYEQHFSNMPGVNITDEFLYNNDSKTVIKAITKKRYYGDKSITIRDKSRQKYLFNSGRYVKAIEDKLSNKEINAENYLAVLACLWFQYRGIDECAKDWKLIIDHSGRAFTHNISELFEKNNLGYYIYTKRNPMEWYSSRVKRSAPLFINNIHFAETAINVQHLADQLAIHYQNKYPNKFKIFAFDKALEDPESAFYDIADFLGLDSESKPNLEATFLGKPVRPNSSFQEKKRMGNILNRASSSKLVGFSEQTKVYIENLINNLQPLDPEAISSMEQDIHRYVDLFRSYYKLLAFNQTYIGPFEKGLAKIRNKVKYKIRDLLGKNI